MKVYNILILILLTGLFLLSFTKDDLSSKSYFPINIKEKRIAWYTTFYKEIKQADLDLQGKTYTLFLQKWSDGTVDSMYLREDKGVVYQYNKREPDHEFVRYNPNFGKRTTWGPTDSPKLYKVKSFNGVLVTPNGTYENLLVIEGRFENATFKFYYQKGIGYIGATTKKDGVVSYLIR